MAVGEDDDDHPCCADVATVRLKLATVGPETAVESSITGVGDLEKKLPKELITLEFVHRLVFI